MQKEEKSFYLKNLEVEATYHAKSTEARQTKRLPTKINQSC